jgi:hypothetical protein
LEKAPLEGKSAKKRKRREKAEEVAYAAAAEIPGI